MLRSGSQRHSAVESRGPWTGAGSVVNGCGGGGRLVAGLAEGVGWAPWRGDDEAKIDRRQGVGEGACCGNRGKRQRGLSASMGGATADADERGGQGDLGHVAGGP